MCCQAVVIGKPFAELKCKAGFTKLRTQINKRSNSNSVALCVKRAAAGTPVSQLLGGVYVDGNCVAEGRVLPGGLKKVPGNLNSHSSKAPRAHLCVSRAGVLRP